MREAWKQRCVTSSWVNAWQCRGIPRHSPVSINLTVSDCDCHSIVLLAQMLWLFMDWSSGKASHKSWILQPVQCADTAVLETTSCGHHTGWVGFEKMGGGFLCRRHLMFRNRKLIQKNARISSIAASEKCVIFCLQLGLSPGYCRNNELNRVTSSTLEKKFYHWFWKKVTKPWRCFIECFLKAKYGWDVHVKLVLLTRTSFSSRGYYASVLN